MEARLSLNILAQPDDATCGPTCLQAIYGYYNEDIPLAQVIAEAQVLETGGTLDVFLACHALRRGYQATIYTYNLHVFDPTWLTPPRAGSAPPDLRERLAMQLRYKHDARLQAATLGYLEFLELGGRLRFEDLTAALIRKYLNRSIPILTGLSATYLYRSAREFGPQADFDDVRGDPSGHFVILCGYDKEERNVLVADPLKSNPLSDSHQYLVNIDRVICSILLGIMTYDANLLIIEPTRNQQGITMPER